MVQGATARYRALGPLYLASPQLSIHSVDFQNFMPGTFLESSSTVSILLILGLSTGLLPRTLLYNILFGVRLPSRL
jgi:hypothetical protein